MRRRLLLALAVASVLASLGGSAATAGAKSYFIPSCDATYRDSSAFGAEWMIGRLDGGDMPVNDCPNGIILDQSGPTEQGVAAETWNQAWSSSTLRSAEFKYYGGDTSGAFAYTVRACTDRDCPVLATLTPGAAQAAPATMKLGLTALQSSSFAIRMECVQVVCPDPPPFVVKKFKLEFDDPESPRVTDLVSSPDVTGGAGSPAWLKGGVVHLAFVARDPGSGVEFIQVAIDDQPGENLALNHCIQQIGAAPCPTQIDISTPLDLSGADEGDHVIRIVVGDFAGTGPTIVDLPIRIDATPPEEPVGLGVSPGVTQWGWTTDPVVTLAHENPLAGANNTSGSGWAAAVFDLRSDPNADPVASSESDEIDGTAEFTLPAEGEWDVGVAYRDNAGNTGNRAHQFLGYDADAPAPPGLDAIGWIKLSTLYSGVDQTWTPPADDPELESGVCGYSFAVDDDAFGIPPGEANAFAPATSAPLPTAIGPGKHFAHVRTIACNGKASEPATEPVNVDGAAPETTLHGLTGDGWITSPPKLSLSAVDAGSGTAALEYGFSGDAGLDVHPGAVASLTVPQGESTLSYAAIDAVGNESAIKHQTIRADWTRPSAEFAVNDLLRPDVVTAHIEDRESGLASVAMQIRRVDSGASLPETAWRMLGMSENAAPQGRTSFELSRAIPDESLDPGVYEVRVLARDLAGNLSDAAPVRRLTLPLRAASTLNAAIALVGKGGRTNWPGATQERLVRFGTKAVLVGTLTNAQGDPVAGAPIDAFATPEFGVEAPFGDAETDSAGEFEIPIRPGVNREFRVEFAGTHALQPATAVATLDVRAALEMKIAPRRLRSGGSYTISGRLLSKSLGTVEGRKVVTIEYLSGRDWIPTLKTPRVDEQGRFRVRTPKRLSTVRPTTIYFHVKANRDGAWPFFSGSSKPFALRLLP